MSTYRYFAFISYSRTDMKAASFIQSELEHFRYPKESIKPEYRPDDPTFVREVFLDKTGLSGQGESFENKLNAALADSRYLIVLCSPESAKAKTDPRAKHYVEWEINTFIKHHGVGAKNRIIPIVLHGEPNTSENSCLPRPLRTSEYVNRNLPDMRPAKDQTSGFFGQKKSWHAATVTLLSYIFDVERSIIFDRFTAERAKMRLKIGIASAAAILVCALLSAWGFLENLRRKDEAALKSYVEATYEFNTSRDGGIFRDSDYALADLSNASRLPVAREFLHGLLLQRSWIVPRREDFNVMKYRELFQRNANCAGQKITTPSNYPIHFVTTNGIVAIENATGKELWSQPDTCYMSGQIDPTGITLLLNSWRPDHALVALDPFTGRRLWSRKVGDRAKSIAFSPNGRHVSVLSVDGHATIVDARDGNVPYETYCAGPDAFNVAFTRDSSQLLIEKKGRILVCDLIRSSPETPIKPSGAGILACGVSSDKSLAAIVSSLVDNTSVLEIRDAKTFAILDQAEIKDGNQNLLSFSGGDFLAVGGGDSSCLSIFRLSAAKHLNHIASIPANGRIEHIASIPGGFVFCVALQKSLAEKPGLSSRSRLMRWSSDAPDKALDITPPDVIVKAITRNGNLLHILSTDVILSLDVNSLHPVKKVAIPAQATAAFITAGDNGVVAIATKLLRKAIVFNTNGSIVMQTPEYSEGGLLPIALSNGGCYFAAAVDTRKVQIFDVRTGKPISRTFSLPDEILSLKFTGDDDGSLRLVVFGGPKFYLDKQKNAYYATIDPHQNRVIGVRSGIEKNLSKAFELNKDALLISGHANSYVYIVPQSASGKQLSQEGFDAICSRLSGRAITHDGISQPLKTDPAVSVPGMWQRFINEAEMQPTNRHAAFTSQIPIASTLSTLEKDYFDGPNSALDIAPNHEGCMAEYWFPRARMLIEDRYAFQHPEKTKREIDLIFSSWDSAKWRKMIFNDPQSRYFCDAWTKLGLEIFPNGQISQHQREVFQNNTVLPKPKEFDAAAVRAEWKQFCKTSNEDPIHTPLVLAAANAYSADATAFDEYLQSLKTLLIRYLNDGPIDHLKISSISFFIGGDIENWAHSVPGGDASNEKFLQELIEATKACRPAALSNKLQCYLYTSLADCYLLQGKIDQAKSCVEQAKQTENTVIGTYAEVYEAWFALLRGDGAAAAKKIIAYLDQYKADYGVECQESMAREFWKFTMRLKQTGVAFGDFSATFENWSCKFHNGVEIRVAPESEAVRMGWKDGDQLIQMNGVDIIDGKHLDTLFARRRLNPNHTTEFTLRRGDKMFKTQSSARLIGFFY